MEKKMVYKKSAETLGVERIAGLYQKVLSCSDQHALKGAVEEILKLQNEDGSWRVVADEVLPYDIVVEYVLFPTYYATAALMSVMLSGNAGDQCVAQLKKGLEVVTKYQFRGHGFIATKQLVDAFTIYREAGVYSWIVNYGDVCPEFGELVELVISFMRNALASNRVIFDWDTDFTDEFTREVEAYEKGMCEYVWYACYGSNMSKERFMKYIRRCSDTTEPVEEEAMFLPYSIYFAYNSSTWSQGGVAFLDDTQSGLAYGRRYKIKSSQFHEIMRMEGAIYSKKITLNSIDGIPCYTFTSPVKRTDSNVPSREYFETIVKGILETNECLTKATAEAYLLSRGILGAVDLEVLTTIRVAPHAVPVKELCKGKKVKLHKEAIRKLADLGLIKMDSRSIRAGHQLTDSETLLYSVREKREVIDMLLVM